MLIELSYDEKTFGTSTKEKVWFRKEILRCKGEDGLILHSNNIGDEVGEVRVIGILN